MPVKIREENTWKLIANDSEIPANLGGSYAHYGPNESSTRSANTVYTNNESRLIHINATIGIDRDATIGTDGTAKDLVSGSYVLAEITSPQGATTEVANIRDNGNANTQYLFLNPQFFVPIGFSYKIKLYDSDDNDWSLNTTYPNAVETFAWSEYIFNLE